MRLNICAFALAFASPIFAQAADAVYSFTLPSGVEITIVESPLRGDVHPNCKRSGKPLVFKDYRPNTVVKSITGRYQGHAFRLDATCMADAWNGRSLEAPGVVRYFGGRCTVDGGTLYCALRGLFADGAETFVAEWVVTGDSNVRTVMSGSDDIVDLFMKHIDPPEYE